MEKVTKKSQLQVEALESFYSEDKYPSRIDMECHAAAFGLTYKQVQCWFVEKRRREKRARKATEFFNGRSGTSRVIDHCPTSDLEDVPLSTYKQTSLLKKKAKMKDNSIQDLLSPDHILKKVFRKDGPPLGVEFDSFPSAELCHSTESQGATKRRKVMDKHGVGRGSITGEPVTRHGLGKGSITGLPVTRHGVGKGSITGAPVKKYGVGKGSITGVPVKKHGVGKGSITGAPMKKYGVGKGLMTVWRAINPDAGYFPVGMGSGNGEVASRAVLSPSVSRRPLTHTRRLHQQRLAPKQGRLRNKLREKKKNFSKRREVESNKDKNKKLPGKEKCELSLAGKDSQEDLDKIAMLADDEELELRELQVRPNSVECSDHFTTNGNHACSLCKDLLAKFPPNSVKMKQPFYMQPWDLSPEIVKKLFKVFHFLCTYAIIVDISSFSIDDFAQAFEDKDSMLLGKIHVALLKLLLSNVEVELSCGSIPNMSKSCNFLAFMHSVENQQSTLDFWKLSLNPLTWTEILRQVLVAAGFGSKQGAMRKDALSKEMSLMVKYGLRPGTLKGELFRVLLEQGINGLKVSELAKSLQITELNLSSGIEELQSLICSTLSSDITLFEKISSSTYRVRMKSSEREDEEFQSDTDDSGGVDDLSDSGICSSDDDSGCTSGNSKIKKLTYMNHGKSNNSMLTVYTEIDESHPGEVWLLGLMEGEYSDLSMEEKLNALVAVIDLLLAGSSFRIEEPNNIAECPPSSLHSGSGGKIKRLSANQHRVPRPTWVHAGRMVGAKEDHTLKFHPIDSSALISKFREENFSTKRNHGKQKEAWFDLHPMQSVFLGSDRRYNRYWLFLGPCNASDPGHKRVYFESSEDGRWEMIDTEEALCALLSVLDDRGKREALLIESLERRIAFLCQAMSNRMVDSDRIDHLPQSDQSELENVSEDTYSPISEVDNNSSGTANDSLPLSEVVVLKGRKKGEAQKQNWSRIQAFDSWLWNSFYLDLNAVKHGKRSYFDTLTRCESCHDLYWRDEKHCKICHTTFELHFDLEERYAVHVATCREEDAGDTFPKHKVLSSQIQTLKAATHAIESVMPEDALLGAWRKSAHNLWVKRLRRTSSLAELLQALADFVGAINEDKLYECNIVQGSCNFSEEIIASFACMPQTTSALALWLVKLDALIAPYLQRVHSEKRQEISTKGRHARKQ